MAFHQQIALLIYLYAFFRIPPLYKGKGWSLLNTDHLSLTSLWKVCMSSLATSQLGLLMKEELDVEGRIEPMCGTAFPV